MNAPRENASAVDEKKLGSLLEELTLEEKIGLLTGADFWSLNAIEKIGLQKVVLSDGPNGVRGTTWDERDTSLLFPNPSALSATWDPGQVKRAGALMGAQARDKGIAWLLAPNINIHRSPLGGRHFECYSEDPLLTAAIVAGFASGVQSNGVAVTIKHYIGNESETDRMTYDARISEKALREVYLAPFEAGVRAGAWSVMASYNSVNGTSLTDNRRLLSEVLKGELGFDGAVVSDWFATRSTAASANAGLDVAMPGPQGPWNEALVAAVRTGEVAESVIDDKVLRVLRLAARTGYLDGFAVPAPSTTPADAREQLRDIAARAMVVLRNDGGVLPLVGGSINRMAVLGPNAALLTAQGGGSAHVNPVHVISPLAGLREAFGGSVEIDYQEGVSTQRILPAISAEVARDPETGEQGFRVDFVSADGALLGTERRLASRLVFMGTLPAGTTEVRMRTEMTVNEAGTHQFSVSGPGRYSLRIGAAEPHAITLTSADNDLIENLVKPPEHRVSAKLMAGTVGVEMRVALPDFPMAMFGLNHQPPGAASDDSFAAAVEAARNAEVALVFVGTTDEVESEGFDRADMRLPGRQNELVSAVAAVNPKTVVIVNAGTPVEMPWRDEVAAVLWAWLPGQEGGHAIADALTGIVEPGGRLPTTFPAVCADAPVRSTRPVDGVIDYAEGSMFGYRAYEMASIAPAFPFGHGLGYSTWSYEEITAAETESGAVKVQVSVRNTGVRTGREVVQLYLGGEGTGGNDPLRLIGFASVIVRAGESATAQITVDRRTLARWDESAAAWRVADGSRTLVAARSAADRRLTTQIALKDSAA
ncbi:beta-glucosidase [Mycobacterium frederiksbergense]|uniref:Beta-glucosidase n=1 Tax=Mycolicibacterium frederiksbergense TaxID=117567 RepID=A0ABT6KTI8_9MYCO|nr:glycoside hydrolase family 3 C-terminal domain-containing protein [Mycolicibacterium frederiksbergense]MDH6194047.1 beta-glucosidase [Mycolicibacterium frederiksbergense]